MKKFKKIMAVLVAAIMVVAMSSMTLTAFAADDNGTLITNTGVLKVANAKKGEVYNAYRIFDLASFTDEDPSTASHADKTEAYSYVISEHSDWWDFFQQYAILTTAANTDPNYSTAYFMYEPAKISLRGTTDASGSNTAADVTDYHIVYANPNNTAFSNANDDTDNKTSRTDPAGTSVGTDLVTGTNGAVQAFAKLAAAYAKDSDSSTDGDQPLTANYTSSTIAADGVYSFNSGSVVLGYYLVTTSMGTLAALDTTNKEVSVYEKNDEPAMKKEVSTAADGTYYENIPADIGDTVYFKTTITAQQGAKDYVLHDVMEKGFTWTATNNAFISSITLTRDTTVYTLPESVAANAISTGNPAAAYANWSTVTTSLTDGCSFELKLKDAFIGRTGEEGSYAYSHVDIEDGDVIEIVYSATLNANAAVYGTPETAGSTANIKSGTQTIANQPTQQSNTDQRNTNTTILTYGGGSYTEWDTAKVTTYQFDIAKTKTKAQSKSALANEVDYLAGAHFSVYKALTAVPTGYQATDPAQEKYVKPYTLNDGTTPITYYQFPDNKLVFTDATTASNTKSYKYAGDAVTSASTGKTTDIVTEKNAKVNLNGLESGVYILVEETAPEGYNKLAYPIFVKINPDADHDGDNTANDDDPDEGTIGITLLNNNNSYTTNITETAQLANIGTDATSVTGTTLYTYNTSTGGGVHVENSTTEELPSTGGMGTTVLYIVGGMLVILAGAYLFFSRKKTA